MNTFHFKDIEFYTVFLYGQSILPTDQKDKILNGCSVGFAG